VLGSGCEGIAMAVLLVNPRILSALATLRALTPLFLL
jgi:hypothetical protein